jgi:hypothetical protein
MPQDVEASMKISDLSGDGGVMIWDIHGSDENWQRHQVTSSATLAGIWCLKNVEVAWEKEADRW